MKFKHIIFSGVFLFSVLGMSPVIAEEDACLNGFELTAIAVLESDIRQAVSAYACQLAFPQDGSTYTLYNQLRNKWPGKRTTQRKMRDSVYQRIYRDDWQIKVDDWTRAMALTHNQSFAATDIACQSLRNQMGAQAHDWARLYADAGREAAQEKYDPLRCVESGTIIIKQSGAGQ